MVIDIVDSIDLEALKKLVRLAGGSNLYIPNESSIIKNYRNKKIRKEFKGYYKAISRKFGISEVHARNIINIKKIYFDFQNIFTLNIKVWYNTFKLSCK